MPFDPTAMNEAGQLAHEHLVELRAAMTPEEAKGAQVIIDWLKSYYKPAGYKRLCRPLVDSTRQ